MATILPTRTKLPDLVDYHNITVTAWPLLANGDEGEARTVCRPADLTVQIFGTFGAGGTLVIDGTLDGIHWSPMTDTFGVPIAAMASKLLTLADVPLAIRPRVVDGDKTTSLTVLLLGRV